MSSKPKLHICISLLKAKNLISLDFVHTIKYGNIGKLRLKERIVLHGNCEKYCFRAHRDSASAGLSFVQFSLTHFTFYDVEFLY